MENTIRYVICTLYGKDGAIDVTVTSPLAASNVADAAAKPGASLGKACARKKRETAEACRAEGLVFIPSRLWEASTPPQSRR